MSPSQVGSPAAFDLVLAFRVIPCLSALMLPSQAGCSWKQSPEPRISGCISPSILAQHIFITSFLRRPFLFRKILPKVLFALLWLTCFGQFYIPFGCVCNSSLSHVGCCLLLLFQDVLTLVPCLHCTWAVWNEQELVGMCDHSAPQTGRKPPRGKGPVFFRISVVSPSPIAQPKVRAEFIIFE